MSTRSTTTPAERIDLLLQQAQQFRDLDVIEEAIARLRHALAQCEKELRLAADPRTAREIETRRAYAIEQLRALGAPPRPTTHEHSTF